MDEFTFCFKGDRTYVHGTDLYDSICKYLAERYSNEVTRLDLWIRKIAAHNMVGQVLDVEEEAPAPPAVVCRFEAQDQARKLCLYEQQSPVDCRYAYDEERIIASADPDLDTKSIRLSEHLPFTIIEIVVALNKALVGGLFQPPTGKWYFTRLNLERPFPSDYSSHITVSFDNSFGLHLTRSNVVVDGTPYGDIFFSLVQGKAK